MYYGTLDKVNWRYSSYTNTDELFEVGVTNEYDKEIESGGRYNARSVREFQKFEGV